MTKTTNELLNRIEIIKNAEKTLEILEDTKSKVCNEADKESEDVE